MADRDTWERTVQERRVLRDLLGSLTPEQWQHDSLCSGWTVQDVAAHVISSPQLQQGRLIWETVKARGDVSAVSFADAKRRSALGTARILADFDTYLADPGHFFAARRDDLLLDIVVHSQDILRPLSIDHSPPPGSSALAARRAVAHRRLLGTRKLLGTVRLVARDTDWQFGTGPTVEGPMLELLMIASGRSPHLAELTGAGCRMLSSA